MWENLNSQTELIYTVMMRNFRRRYTKYMLKKVRLEENKCDFNLETWKKE